MYAPNSVLEEIKYSDIMMQNVNDVQQFIIPAMLLIVSNWIFFFFTNGDLLFQLFYVFIQNKCHCFKQNAMKSEFKKNGWALVKENT